MFGKNDGKNVIETDVIELPSPVLSQDETQKLDADVDVPAVQLPRGQFILV